MLTVTGSVHMVNGNFRIFSFFITLPIENCITMTRNA